MLMPAIQNRRLPNGRLSQNDGGNLPLARGFSNRNRMSYADALME